MKKYDIVYSLGSTCRMSDYLRMSGLRLTSGPFDWTGIESVATDLSWIDCKFKDFLRKEDLYIDDSKTGPKRTIWYVNRATRYMFPHEFVYGREFNEMFAEVHAKYERRIARLLASLENKKVLFTYLARAIVFNRDETIAAFTDFRKRHNNRVDLICFVEDSPGEVVRESPAPGIEIVHYRGQGNINGDWRLVKGEEEVVMPILREFFVPGGVLSNRWMAFKRWTWRSKISRKGNRTYRFFGIPVWKEKVVK